MRVYRIRSDTGLWLKYKKKTKETRWVEDKRAASWWRKSVPDVAGWVVASRRLPPGAVTCKVEHEDAEPPVSAPGDD